MADVERDHELHVLRAARGDLLESLKLNDEPAVRHAELGEDLVHGLRQLRRGAGTLRGERAGGGAKRGGRLRLARDQASQVQAGGVEQIQLGLRFASGSDHVGERGSVLLCEPEQQVASRANRGESRRIEVDAGGIVRKLARQRFERVVAGVEAVLETRERGVESLQLLQRTLRAGEPLEEPGLLVVEKRDQGARGLANLGRVLETARLILEAHAFPIHDFGVRDLM